MAFLRKIYRLRRWEVTSFCMQLKKLTRETKVSGRERVFTWYKGERREKGKTSFWQLISPFLNLMPLLQSLVPRAYNQGIKSKAGAIKCSKEKKLLPRLMNGVTFL